VTTAVYVKEAISPTQNTSFPVRTLFAFMIILSQIIGGIAGVSFSYAALHGKTINSIDTDELILCPPITEYKHTTLGLETNFTVRESHNIAIDHYCDVKTPNGGYDCHIARESCKLNKIIAGNQTYGFIDYRNNDTNVIEELDIGHDIRTYTVIHDGATQVVRDSYVKTTANFAL
jgi:hypothetical protein